MKQKLSITIEEDKIKLIEDLLKEGLFRNKSHILEFSLNRLLKEILDSKQIKKTGELIW